MKPPHQPNIKSETWPSTPLLVGVVVDAGVPIDLAGSGVVGLEEPPAFLKADVDGASLMGVPTLGVLEGKGDCVGSSTAMGPPDAPFSIGSPEILDRRSGCPISASACAGSY